VEKNTGSRLRDGTQVNVPNASWGEGGAGSPVALSDMGVTEPLVDCAEKVITGVSGNDLGRKEGGGRKLEIKNGGKGMQNKEPGRVVELSRPGKGEFQMGALGGGEKRTGGKEDRSIKFWNPVGKKTESVWGLRGVDGDCVRHSGSKWAYIH